MQHDLELRDIRVQGPPRISRSKKSARYPRGARYPRARSPADISYEISAGCEISACYRYLNEVQRPIAVPAVQALGPGAVYQDDNAPAHPARVATDFLTNQNVNRMNWPALSPDLNPIEHLWDELGRRIHANYPPPRNVNDLFRNLNQEWNQLPQRTIGRLVDSMRRRCQAVIAAQGGHTRY